MRTGLNIIAAASAANGASTGRDRRRLGALFLLPVAIMAIIGITMGGYREPSLVVGVLDRAGTGASRELISAIAANQHMRIRNYTDQEKNAHRRLPWPAQCGGDCSISLARHR